MSCFDLNLEDDKARDDRDWSLMKQIKPTLRHCGFGWYCLGRGMKIHASTPKAAYDCWEFACLKGYGWEKRQAMALNALVDGVRRG